MDIRTVRENGIDDMIDIHCHILPEIDDGAGNVCESKVMWRMQQEAGVDRMYMTPHFHPDEKPLDVFLADRQKAWHEFSADIASADRLKMRLGAEAFYCPELLSEDLRKLTLGESRYLLLEFPEYYPAYARISMEKFLDQGIIPILAHVERYSYFREDPKMLEELINIGVLAQVNAQSLFDKRDKGFAKACLYHNLAQIVASDGHNIAHRRPCMELLHKLPEEIRQLHETVTTAVWENELPAYFPSTPVHKAFFGYR